MDKRPVRNVTNIGGEIIYEIRTEDGWIWAMLGKNYQIEFPEVKVSSVHEFLKWLIEKFGRTRNG